MTLLRTEGFDWFETADLPTGYGSMSHVQPTGTMTDTIEETGGRNGDKSLKITPGTGSFDERYYNIQGKAIPIGIADGAEVIFGFAVKFDTVQEAGNLIFCGITNGGIGSFSYNVNLIRLASGVISAGYSTSNIYAGTAGTTVLAEGIWYYLECKFVADNSAGAIEVRINGNVEFSVSGIDTQQNIDLNVSLVLGATIPATTVPVVEFDDVYICDDNGSVNNDYLGDVQIKALFPNGNGTTSNFTGSDADSTDNYLHVDDGPAPDDDSSYVEDNVSTNKDLYTFDNLPAAAASVLGVTVRTLGKKVDTGAADLKNVVRSSTTESDSADLGMGVSYTAKQTVYEQDPDTATAWTTSGVDAMEAGVKVS